ncbi:MAG TPA: PadR family transcriptional regulator [Streptosporangiaceae bacterium]|jgi:DNA-binding PadR family transcriptional regulator|nr:PadR family transcriptional regulator [Streptosporangiaceae bacterium]
MAGRQLTDFEQVLLLMVAGAPSTGYDLKQAFATTPLGVYQPSSGALYPALRRLERRGLLRADPGQPSDQARRRFIYHITEAGLAAHAAWVRQPVNPATISQDLPLHLMRFVAMETLLPRAEVLAFLADVRDALAAFLDGLERYTSAADFGDRHSPLALDHGVSAFAASLAWTKRAINTLSREPDDTAGARPCLSPGAAPPSRRVRTSRPAGS